MELAEKETTLEIPLLKNRQYLSLLGSQIVSNLGDWLTMLAILTLIGLKWEATPWQITGATLCMLVPMLFGGPLAGLLADRVERKKIMIISDISRIFIVGGLIFVQEIWQLYMLLAVKSAFDVMFSPAKSGKIKEIVPGAQIEQAVSYSAIIEQGSKIVGPALGGLLTAAFGVQACFLVNACTFLISALFLFNVPGRSQTPAGEQTDGGKRTGQEKESFLGNLAEGLRGITSIPVIAYGLLALSLVMLVLQIADSQTIVLFREIEGLPSNLLGWCIALSGVGTLLAALLVRVLKAWTPLGKMGVGAALMGILFFVAGVLAEYESFSGIGILMMLACFLLVGLGAGMTFIPFQIELQKRTPERMTGRVFGTVNSVLSVSSLIGPVIGGYLVTAFGAVTAFEMSGLLVAFFGIVLLCCKAVILKKEQIIYPIAEEEEAAKTAVSSGL